VRSCRFKKEIQERGKKKKQEISEDVRRIPFRHPAEQAAFRVLTSTPEEDKDDSTKIYQTPTAL
jgi:hypothetical protein